MPRPFSVRAAPEHAFMFRELARAIRKDPTIADRLTELLKDPIVSLAVV
jgi:hypothetical protein